MFIPIERDQEVFLCHFACVSDLSCKEVAYSDTFIHICVSVLIGEGVGGTIYIGEEMLLTFVCVSVGVGDEAELASLCVK